MESATVPQEEPMAAGEQPKADLKVWLGRGIMLIALTLTWLVCIFVFRVLNRTTVYGRQFAGPRRRCLIVSNHQSLIDSFLVGMVVYFPAVLWHPDLAPAHLADAKNFSSHGTLRYIYDILRVIPVARTAKGKRNDMAALRAVRRVLEQGRTLHVFIEGSRSQTEELLPPRREVGGHALVEGVTVLTVYFRGMHAVQEYCKNPDDLPPTLWNRLFGKPGRHTEWLTKLRAGNRIEIAIGRPIPPEEILAIAGQGAPRERQARVAEAIMDHIKNLRKQVQQNVTSAQQ